MKKDILVAVYGSLRKGMGNHDLLKESEFAGKEIIGGYKMIAVSSYPAIFKSSKEDEITIEIYRVSEDVLKSLDWLEGYPNHYNRCLQKTSIGDAWIYFYNGSNRDSDKLVESGDWVNYYGKK